MSACPGSPIHPDGCSSQHYSGGMCHCDCHGMCDQCDTCDDEFDLDDLNDDGMCPGCVAMLWQEAA